MGYTCRTTCHLLDTPLLWYKGHASSQPKSLLTAAEEHSDLATKQSWICSLPQHWEHIKRWVNHRRDNS